MNKAQRAGLGMMLAPIVGLSLKGRDVWEPAANRLCMASALADGFKIESPILRHIPSPRRVWTSDVFDYGAPLDEVGSFCVPFDEQGDFAFDLANGPPGGADWIITNPPFNLALDFTLAELKRARVGVAMLCRTNWLEGVERWRGLFEPHPLTAMAQFVERVPMTEGGSYQAEPDEFGNRMRLPAHRGGYDPEASTATSYAWFVWVRPDCLPSEFLIGDQRSRLLHIPPCRERLTMPDDARRFGKIKEAPHG